ncbi:helix-turn-helix domain-containing protein [Rhodovulum sp. PH10]|uniref:helix-turn-helix domain-containing protein n=1 Tax=Rhodovulum sp. PH10 TaxID=1187851 RepID=UPI0009FF02F0|nr:helix-turn-helix transcriptional regulator [Rhodovulum sp. PH10]
MSTWLQNDHLAAKLKDALKKKGVSLRDLSEALQIPYRSVQNYLSGESRIPADFLLNVCNYTGIEADFFIYGDFRLVDIELYYALFAVLDGSDLLPQLHRTDRGAFDSEDQQERQRIVSGLTTALIERYDRYRADWLANRLGPENLPPGKRRAFGRAKRKQVGQ